jgi:class 3 adenylate cyclase
MKCPKCQFDNPQGAKFCNECGQKLGVKEVIEKVEPSIEGERKQATVLFSDLSGYTAMTERLDPEEVKEIMSQIFGEIASVVNKYDGTIEKFIGDAVVALFGVPKVHEDDPVRAIRAAREINKVVDFVSPQFESKVGKHLAMHTGINTGLLVTGEATLEKGTIGVTGDTVNLASRLSGLANPGEILVGQETYRQAEGYFDFESLEPVKVKGKAEAINVYKVLFPKEGATKIHRLSGMRADLIGRKGEMAVLGEAIGKLREGKGSILSVCGEAGTGKTRLIEDFKATLDLQNTQWREGHAYAYSQNIPYFPLIDLLNRAWRIEEGFAPEKVRERVESAINDIGVKRENLKNVIP